MACIALSVLIVAAAAAPTLPDHFPDDGALTHAFLLVEASTGQEIRSEGGDLLRADHHLGDLRQLVIAATGLEDGTLDPNWTVSCDSTCWALGSHGDVTLVEGLAWSCDRWRASISQPNPSTYARVQAALGLRPASEGRLTVKDAISFWRTVSSLSAELRAETSTQLLAVAGSSVSSPRGNARALHDSRRRTRAFVAGGTEGAWVIGGQTVLGREWAFALYLPGGTPALAASRVARLLDETRRVARKSTLQRGGQPTEEDDDS